jgi:hypothetical protein
MCFLIIILAYLQSTLKIMFMKYLFVCMVFNDAMSVVILCEIIAKLDRY